MKEEKNRNDQSESSLGDDMKTRSESKKFGGGFFLVFATLFVTWLLLSGRLDRFHIVLGLVSCLIVATLSADLVFPALDFKNIPAIWLRFVFYIPWLLYQMARANLHVMYLVFHPRMRDLIDPKIIKFKSKLKSDLSLTTFANSITLTPGTITVVVTEDGDFEVHCIDRHSGESLPGQMEERIAKVFGE